MSRHQALCGAFLAIMFIASVWAGTRNITSLRSSVSMVNDDPRDKDRLGMAIEYFQSGKYHEALLIFENLDKEYELNPRYHAYMGVCCYYEWLYEDACRYLDEAIPQLDAFAPHERSVYYYCNGESHFQLRQYKEAIPYFERALTVCFENEKGDIHYRLGLCRMFAEEWQEAHDHYQAALDNYLTYRDTPEMRARIYQTAHMMKGCESHLKKGLTEADFGSAVKDRTNDTDSILTTIPATTDIILPTIPILTADSIQPTIPVLATDSIPVTIPTMKTIPQPVTITKSTPTPKDTIRSEVPRTVNIQDLFNQKIDVAE